MQCWKEIKKRKHKEGANLNRKKNNACDHEQGSLVVQKYKKMTQFLQHDSKLLGVF